jgi:pilus assembly protein CpaB
MLLVLALGCGLVASIGISQVMDRNANQRVSAVATAPIYVALHNINLGDPIDASMVSLQEWPKDKIPPGTIAQLEDLEGRRPRATIIQGEPILDAKLLAPGQLSDPITSIPTGFRLKTISVSASSSASGLLSPGDRVDVQLFVKRDERNGIASARTKVILQNIRVFAIDQTVQRSPDGGEVRAIAKTISLLLTPDQASRLTLAENLGDISLIPRNPNDEGASAVAELTVDDLLGEGGRNTREKEQAKNQAADTSANDGLLTQIQQHLPPPIPPFIMEVIEAQDVREMEFDAETGKPLREKDDAPRRGSKKDDSTIGVGTPSETSSENDELEPEPSLDDFPIDFEPTN